MCTREVPTEDSEPDLDSDDLNDRVIDKCSDRDDVKVRSSEYCVFDDAVNRLGQGAGGSTERYVKALTLLTEEEMRELMREC